MSNSNTPNEPESKCSCLVCVALPDLARAAGCVPLAPLRAEAAARAPETATEYILREFSEALKRAEAAALRAIAYDRACHSAADIHCASTDRRDDNEDPRRAERLADLKAFARAGRYADNARRAPAEETVFPALDRLEEDTDTGPAGAD